jgi:hypothetical protein
LLTKALLSVIGFYNSEPRNSGDVTRSTFRWKARGRKLNHMRKIVLATAAIGLLLGLSSASAQTMRYPVKSVDFDIWCTEIAHIAWQRCDKRNPDDLAKFEAYRHTIERYEIPYLKQQDSTLRFDENILRNDPVDKRPDSTVQKPPGVTDGGEK